MGDKPLYHLPADIYIIQTGYIYCLSAKECISLGGNAFFLFRTSLRCQVDSVGAIACNSG